MDVYILLDILLIILVALFIPIGFWRGAYREAFVTLGILFGASLGRFWGESWGTELAAVTRLHESGGAFMIAMLCLISATFLLGYSSGAAMPVPDPGWIARTLGALIAGANGALLLSFALRDIRVYLLSSQESGFLDNAYIAPFLSEGTGWILLVSAAVFVPISLVLALFGPDVEEDEFYEEDDFEVYEDPYHEPHAQRTMQHGQRRPVQSSAPPQPQAPAAPAQAAAQETRPVPGVQHSPQETPPQAVSAQHPQPPADAAPRQPQRINHRPSLAEEPAVTQRRVPGPEETQPHRPQMGPQQPPREPVDVPPEPSFGTHSVEESTEERRLVFGHRPNADRGSTQSREGPEHACPNCQADIRNADGYCPQCGHPLFSGFQKR